MLMLMEYICYVGNVDIWNVLLVTLRANVELYVNDSNWMAEKINVAFPQTKQFYRSYNIGFSCTVGFTVKKEY